MKNKKKTILSIIIILIILVLIITIILINNVKKEINSVNSFRNVKELVEYYDCTYISLKKSEEDGYNKDLKIIFSINPLESDGTSNELKYKSIISSVGAKMNNKDFRIIDESKNLIIRVKFTEEGKASYTINNDADYFEHLLSNYSIDNELKEEMTNIQINSRVLSQIISKNWQTVGLNIGTIDSIVDKYDVYFDEGYKIRKVNGKVFNIVFTKKYSDDVVNNLKTNSTFEVIQNALGQATYSSELDTGTKIIGYKAENLYVFFTGEEISIYPNQEIDNQAEFANLVSKLIEEKNIQEFLSKLTDIWPDYSEYTIDNSNINIKYPLKGVEIEVNNNSIGAIRFYNNYTGNVTKDKTIEDIKVNKIIPAYMKVSLSENMVNMSEKSRIATDDLNRNPWDNGGTIKNDKYVIYLQDNRCDFYSRDKENIDSIINIDGLNNIYQLNDTMFVYSLEGKGIYVYEANNMRTTQIVSGTDKYKIIEIKDNTIYYDKTSIKVNI